jgi:molybdopterin/thiamine biosynthesis adenylyltransferase
MRFPRVKPEHAPYRIAGGKVRIGGVSYGLAAEIDDPDGWVWSMLLAMDGTRELTDVIRHVARLHPRQPAGDLRAGAEQLVGSGYVEDAAAPAPPGLSERDLERHDRAAGFFRWLDLTPRASSWDAQEALRRARVTIVGVGGTGGVAALALAASGVGRLHCVDPDVVELSNLNRQVIYGEADIGRPKADAAVERLKDLNRDIQVTAQRLKIEGRGDLAGLAAACDVLLLAADQPPEIRDWANRACLAAGRPWVDACYHGPLVQVGAFVPGEGCCWECGRLAARDQHAGLGADEGDNPGRGAAISHAAGAVSAGLSGYLAAHAVISLLTGIPPVVPGRVNTVNLAALDAPFAFDSPPHPQCSACRDAGTPG